MLGLETFTNILRTFSWTDLLDIFVVACFIYWSLQMVHEIRAQRLFKSVIILAGVYWVSTALSLTAINFMLRQFFAIGAVAIVVVFQPELRRILERFGRTKIIKTFWSNENSDARTEAEEMITIICNTCNALAENKTGALIVIKTGDPLEDVARSGTILDAKISQEFFLAIFSVYAPLHDGAVLIDNNRAHAAGCILPLTQKKNLNKKYGTRHRAGIGISENSDAVVVIVSEETGSISTANKGELTTMESSTQLHAYLMKKLVAAKEKKQRDGGMLKIIHNWRMKKRKTKATDRGESVDTKGN
jgi:diadenylate cyclase